MMPEFGKYAVTILASWGATLVLLAGLVAATLIRGAQVKRALKAQEERMKNDG
ncbi:heme exporter protein CcmD [Rhodobacter capsulatus]|uniref:heme exporter protein CcmD n=1 Tax=Rhodobacter capsulatus TaxID=1061 RepID=UPI0003D375CF|nr:heme exporter protein CcmD [Rhodobacter capsulatus]ETD84509.1 Heme exporter protein D [Rhodobacter capsulatus YW1]ETD91881.1 Heme exporter protein D [Rhodobacter capsulatus YW2]